MFRFLEFDMFCTFCGSFAENCGDLQRLSFFHKLSTHIVEGDLRRRRVRTKAARKRVKVLKINKETQYTLVKTTRLKTCQNPGSRNSPGRIPPRNQQEHDNTTTDNNLY